MIAVPSAFPVTTPARSTEATEASLVDHPPPGVAEANVEVEPRQIAPFPPIAAGLPFTVNTEKVRHPVSNL